MEVLLIFAGFWLAMGALGWLVDQVSNFIKKERGRRRDEIAEVLLEENQIYDADFTEIDSAISKIIEILPKRLSYHIEPLYEMPSGNSMSRQFCDKCKYGVMITRRGKYGQFLGCSNYPSCDNTKHIGWVNKKTKEQYKEKFKKQFAKDLEKAFM